jgi:hypothetical protein
MRVALVRELFSIDRMELGEAPDPTPAAEQVVVRVRGAGVGPWDAAMISGTFGSLTLPFSPGLEAADFSLSSQKEDRQWSLKSRTRPSPGITAWRQDAVSTRRSRGRAASMGGCSPRWHRSQQTRSF